MNRKPPSELLIDLKNLLKHLKFQLAPYVLTLVAWPLLKSCRLLPVQGNKHIEQLLASKKPFLPSYWHQQILYCVDFLLGLQKTGLNLGFLTSPSRDGEIGAKIFEFFGAKAVRGSSSRTGAQALRDIYLAVAKDNLTIGTTPDGPRGPAFEFKQGPIILAQLSGAPIVPIAYSADRFWQLKTWDHFLIPKPFARIAIAVGEPLYVAKKLAANEIADLQEEMTRRLNNLRSASNVRLSRQTST